MSRGASVENPCGWSSRFSRDGWWRGQAGVGAIPGEARSRVGKAARSLLEGSQSSIATVLSRRQPSSVKVISGEIRNKVFSAQARNVSDRPPKVAKTARFGADRRFLDRNGRRSKVLVTQWPD